MEQTTHQVTKCPDCGYVFGHAWTCPKLQVAYPKVSNTAALCSEVERVNRKLTRARRAFSVANTKRHHAEARADDLAYQRNSARSGFFAMQTERNEREAERDAARAEVERLRDLLNQAHAERDNARDDAEGLRETVVSILSEFVAGAGDDCPEYYRVCILAAKHGIEPRVFPRNTIGAYFNEIHDVDEPPFPLAV